MKGKTIASAALASAMAVCTLPVTHSGAAAAGAALYSMDEMLAPVWEGETSYQESVLVVMQEDGSIAPISLLYPIDEVLSVKSATLTKEYTSGKDYSVADGKLVIPPESAVPRLSYVRFHPQTGPDGFESSDGGYVLWQEGSWFHEMQIVVTYTHTQPYEGYVPEGKGNLLQDALCRLEKDTLNLLVYGDSISVGGNSSGNSAINVSPYMPIYPELFAEGLKRRYAVQTVNVLNASVGGTDSDWGVTSLRSQVFDRYAEVDLAIVAFGMNDTMRDPQSYANNIVRIAKALRSKYGDIDVLMVAPMLPNEKAVTFWGNQQNFYEALKEYETEGMVAVNVTGVHASLLQKKSFADMTGNNINHANDYLARIYAQTLLRTLEVSEEPSEPETPSDDEPTLPETPTDDAPVTPDAPAADAADESGKGCAGMAACGTGGALAVAVLGAACVICKRKK